ncbi:hypothetical protein V0288_10115, partial [Pannus brasiliensis CCIBt3594]
RSQESGVRSQESGVRSQEEEYRIILYNSFQNPARNRFIFSIGKGDRRRTRERALVFLIG